MQRNVQKKKPARKTKVSTSTEESIEKPDSNPNDQLTIVGIGASAGGLDALQKVLPELPINADIAYVVVQHLAPKPSSLLPSLLSRSTRMTVETIRDGMQVQAGTIYITPPKKDVHLSGNRLRLKESSSIGPKPSIDYFFSSLAEEKKAHAVGIILSGSGSDGAHGMRAIKSHDGITMAQTAESAKFGSMPQAAIDTGLVDLVLAPEKIGPELEAALKYPSLIAGVPLDRHADEINTILKLLQQQTGADFSQYKEATVHRRISRRMVVNKASTLNDYITLVKAHPDELACLHKDLLISVTRFFRDREAFTALSKHIQKRFKDKAPGDAFRVWVPGCATGEETYSIAIMLNEMMGGDLSQFRIQIFGTDIDSDSVQIARKGIYPIATVMDTNGEWFEKYFSIEDHAVKLKKHIRDQVVLAHQDLIKDTPFLHLDLISCRNLMIYFNDELQEDLLSLFHYSLEPDGLLFLGKSESANHRKDLFKTVDAKWRIYQRKPMPSRKLPPLTRHHYLAPTVQTEYHRPIAPKDGKSWQESKFVSALMDVLESCALLTDEQGNIFYIRGDASPYFKLPEGRVKDALNAVEMAKPEFRYALQSLLHKSSKLGCTVANNCVAALNGAKDGRGVNIRVGPINEKLYENSHLIVLTPVVVANRPSKKRDASQKTEEHERIRELERELDATRDHLQDTIEELETTTEELQSLNEELQSANEELQAANEELETSNEELHASNEELNTVNDELRAKSDEASELMEDLRKSEQRYRDLVQSANSAIIRWRRDGVITFFNEFAQRLFGYAEDEILGKDVNILLPHRESTGSDLTGLVQDILRHPDKFTSNVNENVCRDGRRIWINWTNRAVTDKAGDVVEILAIGNDITVLKATEQALRESEAEQSRQRRFLESLLDTTQACISVMAGRELRFTLVNKAYQNLRPDMPMVGRTYREVFPDAVAAGAEALVQSVIETGVPQSDFGYTVSIPGKPDATWDHQIIRLPEDEGGEPSALIITWDSTEHSRARTALHHSEEQLKASLMEKETLLKEIHHRVKNNMQVISSLVSLQADTIMDEKTKDLLADLSHRVRSMAMVHEKLYQAEDLSNLEFADYVRSLLNYLWRSNSANRKAIRLTMDLKPVLLTVEKAVPCGLILNELVSNALKHAFKGRDGGQVSVSLRNSGRHRIELIVRDNGIGLPPDLDWRQAGSLGLRLVRLLSKQLDATIELLRDEGTEFRLAFEG